MRIFHPQPSRLLRGLVLLGTGATVFLAAPFVFAQSAQAEKPAQTAKAATRQPVLADAIVAVVNSEVITHQELLDRVRDIEARTRGQNVQLPPRSQIERQMLDQMIIEKAQMQLAKSSGIRVDDVMLDRAIGRIAEQNNLTVPQMRAQLEKEGTTFPRFREEIRQEITLQRLREREVDNKLQISKSEVDNYLAAQSGNAQARQELNIAHILIRIPENASETQIAERRRRAEEVLRQLREGGDFAKLAARYSEVPDGAGGGDLGWRTADRLPQLFVDGAANLEPGQTSPILRSGNGFHILKLAGKRNPSLLKANGLPAAQQTRARHILIKTNQLVTPNEARRKLTELKQRLDNNAATFEDLAKLFSNDLSASKGGDLGWLYPGDTVPEFERAMNALKPGEISEPVESPFGLHLIQVVERKTDDVSPERLRLQARQAIRERKLQEATQEWLRQLRDRTYVEYRLDTVNG